MSTDYTPYALVGLRLPAAKLFKIVQVMKGLHSFPDHYTYNPLTGEPLWESERRFVWEPEIDIDAFDKLGLKLAWHYRGDAVVSNPFQHGYWFSRVRPQSENSVDAYIGIPFSGDINGLQLAVNDARVKLRQVLGSLYCEQDIGIYPVLEVF